MMQSDVAKLLHKISPKLVFVSFSGLRVYAVVKQGNAENLFYIFVPLKYSSFIGDCCYDLKSVMKILLLK